MAIVRFVGSNGEVFAEIEKMSYHRIYNKVNADGKVFPVSGCSGWFRPVVIDPLLVDFSKPVDLVCTVEELHQISSCSFVGLRVIDCVLTVDSDESYCTYWFVADSVIDWEVKSSGRANI